MPVGILIRAGILAAALAAVSAVTAGALVSAVTAGAPVSAVTAGAPVPTATAGAPVTDSPAAADPFVDDLGRRCALARAPRRIVSLSPSLTEVLFAMACDSLRIVGATRFCDYPPEARLVARVGGIVDPSLEAILQLDPDLVVATRGNPLEFMESLIGLGVPVFALDDRGDLGSIPRLAERLGRLLDCAAEAGALRRGLDERLESVRARTSVLEEATRPRVYFGELEGALWTAGPGSHIDGLISAAGGVNVAAGAPAAWCPLSLEAIVLADPQVYFGTFPGDDSPSRRAEAEAAARAFLSRHSAWRGTMLGRDPRIFLVQEDRVLRPGPRVYDVLEEFARFLHPELFPAVEE